MVSFKVSTLILRPVPEVFAFIIRPENNSIWQYGSIESVQISDGEVAAGTLFSSFGHFMGRRIQSTFEVTEFEPNRIYAFKTISGPVKFQATYVFEAGEQGTNVRVSSQFTTGGFFNLIDTIVARTARKQFTENLARAKQLLETKEATRQD